MLALDVNLQQSWCGEELLTLVTFMELHICKPHEERTKTWLSLENNRAGVGVMANTQKSIYRLPGTLPH